MCCGDNAFSLSNDNSSKKEQHSSKDGVNKPKSPFILRADDIQGLSAIEIAEKYALPQTPDKIVYPKIPSDVPLEISIVGPQEAWGTLGGDAQYAIKEVLLDDDWFADIHDLK